MARRSGWLRCRYQKLRLHTRFRIRPALCGGRTSGNQPFAGNRVDVTNGHNAAIADVDFRPSNVSGRPLADMHTRTTPSVNLRSLAPSRVAARDRRPPTVNPMHQT